MQGMEQIKSKPIAWKDNLNWLFDESDRSKNNVALAEYLKTTPVTVHNLRDPAKTAKLDAEYCFGIASFFGVDPWWFLTGEGSPDSRAGEFSRVKNLSGPDQFAASSEILPSGGVNFELDDDSFEARLWRGDILFVDTSSKTLKNSTLYVFKSGNTHFMKRFWHNIANGKSGLLCGLGKESDELPELEFNKMMERIEVVGEVVGRFTRRL